MPWIHVETSVDLTQEKKNYLLAELSKATASVIGKPELYVMAGLERSDMMMSGTPAPCAWVEIKSIGGLTPAVVGKLAAQITGLLEKHLQVARDRVYMNFADVPAKAWAWNGEPFG